MAKMPGSLHAERLGTCRKEWQAGRLGLHRHGIRPGYGGGSKRSMAQRRRSDQTESSKATIMDNAEEDVLA